MIYTLSNEEITLVNSVGKSRQEVHDSVGRIDKKVLLNSGISVHTQGAIGELVVSKCFNKSWDGMFKTNKEWIKWRDIGHDVDGLEVRYTTHKNGRLILHNKDKNESIYILVVGHNFPTCEIVGWIYGKEGKNKDYWEDVGYGRPCFYVPRKNLRNIKELIL